MSTRTLRIERAVNELANDLPPGVASEEDVDEHMRRLVEDYGLSVDRAQEATRHYLTATREGVAASLVSQLSRTADTPPTRDAVIAELERLETWSVPLGEASEVIRREHDQTVRTDRDRADHADPADPLRGVPRGATDTEVAAAIPGLDDQTWTSESDLADPDPDDQDILDADEREASDSTSTARPQTASRAGVVTRLASSVQTARRWLPEQ